MNRQEANKQILTVLDQIVTSSPDLRFHQILHILSIEKQEIINGRSMCEDLFHEESEETLKRIQNNKI